VTPIIRDESDLAKAIAHHAAQSSCHGDARLHLQNHVAERLANNTALQRPM
jgi:hypothetical protein